MTRQADGWPGGTGEMAGLMRGHDWAATPLGPSGDWSERFKLAIELMLDAPEPTTLVCAPDHLLLYNDAAGRFYGEAHPGALGRPLPETFPDGWKTVSPLYDRAFAGEVVVVAELPLDTQGGWRSTDVFDARLLPVRDVDGAVMAVQAVTVEIGALKRSEQALQASQLRLQLLLAELQHRVRNILTVIRSVFARTLEGEGDWEELADHFRGRLDSLARTQVIATQSPHGAVDLESLILDELLSVGAANSPRVTVSGPDVALPADVAESIGLAIHELTTNALKYGALKISDATLVIDWSVNMDYSGGRRLILNWREQGVPAVPVTPTREGFGSELIREALPYRLQAETKLEFRGGGVSCTISIPLMDVDASPTGASEGDRDAR